MALTKIDDRGLKTPIDLLDGEKIRFGTGNDFEIYHHSDNNTYIHEAGSGHLVLKADDLYIQNAAGSQTNIKSVSGGTVELSHAGTKKFETTATGVTLFDDLNLTGTSHSALWDNSQNWFLCHDQASIVLGTGGDLKLYHDGSHSWIENTNASQNLIIESQATTGIRGSVVHLTNVDGSHTLFEATAGGSVELYHNNSKKFETDANGAEVLGNRLRLSDDVKLECGAGSDLKIYHTGGDNRLENHGANLYLRTGASGDETSAVFVGNGAVKLYYDNALKFETLSTGWGVADTIEWHATQNSLDFYDGKKASFGSSRDLQIYHDGTDNYWETGAQATHFRVDNGNRLSITASGTVMMQGASGKNFEWKGSSGYLTLTDSAKATYGDDDDLQIYHDGSHNRIDSSNGNIYLRHGTDNAIKTVPNGAVELYYDDARKLYTSASGVVIQNDAYFQNDASVLYMGADNDGLIFHSGSNFHIRNTTGNLYLEAKANENSIRCDADGPVRLYYDSVQKLETTSAGVEVNGDLILGDDKQIKFGSNDLRIYHSASAGDSYIEGTSRDIVIRTTTAHFVELKTNDESAVKCNANSSVQLFFDGTSKLETTSGGVNIAGALSTTGHISPTANNTYDLGDSTYRWRNLYINDLQLSNEGSSNSVDGTWGDWTLQEGENDIFMLNNRTGKKYKMALQEVS